MRVYHDHPARDGMAVRTFGPVGRFDPHVRDRHRQPRESSDGRGVLYLARDLPTALAEAYPGQWPQVLICPHARAGWVRPQEEMTPCSTSPAKARWRSAPPARSRGVTSRAR